MWESFSQQPSSDDEIIRQRLRWLSGIRRYSVVGMILSALIGRYIFGIHLPVHWLALLATVTFLYNHFYISQLSRIPLNPRIAFHQIILDVFFLTLALFLTGGFLNPFFTFYFFAVILAWIILSRRESVYITLMVTAGFSLQFLASHITKVDLRLSNEGLLKMGEIPFHVVGAPLSFVITTVLTAYFVAVIMGDLRKREQEVRIARRQTELELSKLDNILRHVEAGMLVLDRYNRVEWANDRLRTWFGEEGMNEEIACYRISRFLKKQSSHSPSRALEDRTAYDEIRMPTLTQGVRDFEIVVNPIFDKRSERVQLIELVLDITEQKKKKEQWAQAQKLAAIGQLAAGMAHEINTPLGTISILAQEARFLVEDTASQCECPHQHEMEESLRTIHEQTLRCKEITQSLLNVSRAPALTRQPCTVNDLVRRSVELIRTRAGRVSLEEDLDDGLPVTVTSEGEVERALFNLLLNAADALESNQETPCIRIKTHQENGMIRIEVADNGPGIRPEDMPHIFEPFFTTKTVGKGTGLGLYVSYNAIRDLGGRIEIESELDAGTRASIFIPIQND